MKQSLTIEEILYRLGLAAILCVAAALVLRALFPAQAAALWPDTCWFYGRTGLYCPGCGGSRAVKALLRGRIGVSLWDHPFVLYGGGLFVCFMASHTLSRLTGGRVRGMKYRDAYLWIGLILILGNWVLKNIILIIRGTDILL